MKVEVESRYKVGDKQATFRGNNPFFSTCIIVEIKFNDGFVYLVEYEDKCRDWIKECYLYPLEDMVNSK